MSQFDVSARVIQAIDLISQGHTNTVACKRVGISVMTLQRFLKDNTEVAELYDEAQQVGHDTLADALVTPADLGALSGAADEKELKLVSENVKWLLARRDKNRFGDAVTVTHNITADKAIVNALQRGQERAMQRRLEQQQEKSNVIEDVAFEVVDDSWKQFL